MITKNNIDFTIIRFISLPVPFYARSQNINKDSYTIFSTVRKVRQIICFKAVLNDY